MKKINVRELALEALEKLEQNQAYSNLLLTSVIKTNTLSDQDRGLLTELVYGTLQNKIALDYMLKPFIRKPNKVKPWVIQLLRLSAYQMEYLEKIPDRAAIHEAVEIAKKRGHKGIASFVNGILRSLQREGAPSFAEIEDPVLRLSTETSHPEWLVKEWVEAYGFETAEKICRIHLVPPKQTLRVNRIKADKETLLNEMENAGLEAEAGDLSPDAIKLLKGSIASTEFFQNGQVSIQDESSMLVARALDPKPGETVLDACAAPGGKSAHIAELMKNEGSLTSLDLHRHKVKLIQEGAERLGLTIIDAQTMDARKAGDAFGAERFDRILVDAPCSGFGVIRRKPDMKYTKTPEDSRRLSEIQLGILREIAPLVKKGGTLVYSTCTMDRTENEEVMHAFIQEHPEFEPDLSLEKRLPEKARPFVQDGSLQILPHYFGTDGFFISSMRKKG
ncbi:MULTISPECIES: 16S rRNA (cytosine(967)-C(5))-methyltransferase RsmB [Bacillus]|jgi:16S rRNA (cytosine967-C5)-methyltransferase|uniref:16S rRNA (cytosine(967)-C(5))-methyltransferase n=1 Tax=Bacillus amyloliquefaciens (strain ATCC 23350 / DSM 7 / BCRC 11601 / CCUG 28519 / NBRC 15535 / NRRL B-14393 / F) TaxID=692420 RepID=A0A9P1NHF1_BACAS|nr:16S rRNA (cytosine(967)-C(5))-methyltransferase RsmB [Bacillus amyloliquefaciens]AIW33580.1 16S rRNA methyltransferase [Bacillus subtilis]AEB24022.1 16S rRNA methyltransferase B [Bacillus amyloliquefaciens TA208]AEB63274.1 RNA-binding Sun protein; 16S rRNA m5C967 methyltransferase, S-adenosyl-L-methionine-dependent [Bacillus amyloliquefaciens LL3]AEK89019.1 16S rRNA methyltransferase B [Bacillus amyloliquefaciens XH7]AZV89102.1 16S rRNA methyltransferase [Bacillus amyloliquefaciens]